MFEVYVVVCFGFSNVSIVSSWLQQLFGYVQKLIGVEFPMQAARAAQPCLGLLRLWGSRPGGIGPEDDVAPG